MSPLRYGSVCSGIEAASHAWQPLDWTPAWFAEIDPYCSAVLAHHHPDVPNHGDFTTLLDPDHPIHKEAPIDILVGGNLALEFIRLVDVLRPRWVLWENVPGVLSSGDGRDLGSFLGALGNIGYGWAYRVLDAQYFGLAQRRKRVFVVGCLGGQSGRAGAVLFEPESLPGIPPTRGSPREDVSTPTRNRTPHAKRVAFGCDLSQKVEGIGFSQEFQPCIAGHNLHPGHGSHVLIVNIGHGIEHGSDLVVRRVTPRECERLQGFPDDFTLIQMENGLHPDGVRYRAIGNSMAVPCVRWIGERIARVDAIPEDEP